MSSTTIYHHCDGTTISHLNIDNKTDNLLLLRHASKCKNEDGKCTITPYCGEMKKLWKHIANCKDSNCKVEHCMSSRYVLSHYRRCKDPCSICGHVREIIRRENGVVINNSSTTTDNDHGRNGNEGEESSDNEEDEGT